MDTNLSEIQEAADWFERRYSIRLPPIYLNKSIELSHYCWNGKYGCLKDYHICISAKQNREYGLLTLMHEGMHLVLNREIGRVVQDDEPGVEELVTSRARDTLSAFKSRYTHAT